MPPKKKKCKRCKKKKILKEFAAVKAGFKNEEYRDTCRECVKLENSLKIKPIKPVQTSFRVIGQSKKRLIIELKSDRPCELCGEDHPSCIVFHHIDPRKKKFAIAELEKKKNVTLEMIEAEFGKCVALCSNCHRVVHSLVNELHDHHSIVLETVKDAEKYKRGITVAIRDLGLFKFVEQKHGIKVNKSLRAAVEMGYKLKNFKI